ncbi:MAG: universal stress protein [Chitinophagaceae bacterium]|nr:universal stress protein [Chitinophagaceae bacterium]
MIKRIVVPTDFSEEANYALDSAILLAEEYRSSIDLIHIIEDNTSSIAKLLGEEDELENPHHLRIKQVVLKKMEEIIDTNKKFQVEIKPVIEVANKFIKIIDIIKYMNTNLVIMGSKGSDGLEEVFVGSNADKITRYAHCPVITVKYRCDLRKIKNIVYPTDLEQEQEVVIKHLKHFQNLLKARIHILKVYTSALNVEGEVKTNIHKYADYFDITNYTVNTIFDEKESEGILDFAQSVDADIIAMGTHSKKGISAFFGGMISKNIVNHSPIPTWTKTMDINIPTY